MALSWGKVHVFTPGVAPGLNVGAAVDLNLGGNTSGAAVLVAVIPTMVGVAEAVAAAPVN